MRNLIAVFSLLVIAEFAGADGTAPTDDVSVTIDRGLAFLVKDALAWKAKYNCASCHHASLVVWAMQEAMQHGRPVDEAILAELTKWIAESGNGKTSLPRPEGIPEAFNEKAVHFALALGANPEPDALSREGLARLLSTVKADQTENGSWLSWPETRPPIFGHSDRRATSLAALALLPAAATGDVAAKAAADRAEQFLSSSPDENDPQPIALRLVLCQRLGHSKKKLEPLVARILANQNDDGGWSQTDDMTSDAWATGQALYAIAHAGLRRDNCSIQRAHQFLADSQRDDGSWPMTSRPTKPGGEGSTSLVPITGAGAAWAVMGLVRTY